MFTKILAASLLATGLATSAMAQNADGAASDRGSGKSVVVTPDPDDPNAIDPGATNSIIVVPDAMNSTPDENCASSPQGAQADANHASPGTVSPTVNDNNCGK
ncbi:hypothetical protein LHFGNBLO_004679 [Mesorhizobium sp. AR10]|uniref:hypothetical protein n=1 Tax=Mesorhizobium sp. AR10 TaxID=2865839 RepID=UPI00215ED691|nr:hypothetical protein [Mesorhizobium sp. AR10]UVK37616.1 hypothetical protein LHFGNBLO_004679 [Mesorhizobium sp. AR10]